VGPGHASHAQAGGCETFRPPGESNHFPSKKGNEPTLRLPSASARGNSARHLNAAAADGLFRARSRASTSRRPPPCDLPTTSHPTCSLTGGSSTTPSSCCELQRCGRHRAPLVGACASLNRGRRPPMPGDRVSRVCAAALQLPLDACSCGSDG
jgi:hypothetical protein